MTATFPVDVVLLQGPDPVHELPEDQPRQFDICIANILRGPLLDLQPRLSSYVKPSGQLLLSGILSPQVGPRCKCILHSMLYVMHSMMLSFFHLFILACTQFMHLLGRIRS